MKIYIFDKIWNCCMSCSRPDVIGVTRKYTDCSNKMDVVQQQVSLKE